MAHTIQEKKKLLNRVQRIRGQLDAIQRGLEAERDCGEIMPLLAACRGAMGSLTAEIMEGHIRAHVAKPDKSSERARAAAEIVAVLRTYLR